MEWFEIHVPTFQKKENQDRETWRRNCQPVDDKNEGVVIVPGKQRHKLFLLDVTKFRVIEEFHVGAKPKNADRFSNERANCIPGTLVREIRTKHQGVICVGNLFHHDVAREVSVKNCRDLNAMIIIQALESKTRTPLPVYF
jgi:hypothetical protein